MSCCRSTSYAIVKAHENTSRLRAFKYGVSIFSDVMMEVITEQFSNVVSAVSLKTSDTVKVHPSILCLFYTVDSKIYDVTKGKS